MKFLIKKSSVRLNRWKEKDAAETFSTSPTSLSHPLTPPSQPASILVTYRLGPYTILPSPPAQDLSTPSSHFPKPPWREAIKRGLELPAICRQPSGCLTRDR